MDSNHSPIVDSHRPDEGIQIYLIDAHAHAHVLADVDVDGDV